MSANAEIIAELRRVLNERDEAREQLDLTKRELGRWVDRETKAVRERDEARASCPDCAMWAERSARWHDDMQRAERERDEAQWHAEGLRAALVLVESERDEARADAERYLADLRRCASEPYERTRELEALQAEVERLRETKDYLRTWLSSEELEGLRVKAAEHPLLWEEIHHLKDEVERLREMAHDFEAMREDRDEARAERDAAIARITEVGVMVATNGNLLAKDAYRRGAEAMREACAVKVVEWLDHRWATAIWLAQLIRELPIPEEP